MFITFIVARVKVEKTLWNCDLIPYRLTLHKV